MTEWVTGWSSLAFRTKILLFWVFCPTWAVSRHYIISRGCWQTWKRAACLYFPEETQFLSCSAADEKAIKACVVCKPTANAIFHLGSVVNPDSGRSQGEPNRYWVSCRALSHGELCQLAGASPIHPSHLTTLILINEKSPLAHILKADRHSTAAGELLGNINIYFVSICLSEEWHK